MIEPGGRGGVVRVGHYLMVAAVAVVAIVVVITVFSFVVGVFFDIVKFAIVVALIVAAYKLVTHHARRRAS